MRIAVFVVLAIHGVGLLALLMQGCKKEPEVPVDPVDQIDTNTMPAFVEPTNALPVDTAPQAAVQTNTAPGDVPPVTSPPPPVPPPAAVTEYKVVRGDTYTTIARKFNVTIRAITEANPGVDPTKLQIDQVLKIPPPVAPAPNTGAGGQPTPPDVGAGQVYIVKSGDTLIGIAGRFGVSVKALRSANNLTTDRIKVGQKLTIPAKASVPSGTSTAPTGGTPAGAEPPAGQ